MIHLIGKQSNIVNYINNSLQINVKVKSQQNIPDRYFKQYDKLTKYLLWENKKPRINMKKVCSPRDVGGLALPYVKLYNLSFEMDKFAKHWGKRDAGLDWITIEQELSYPFTSVT